MEKDFKYVKLFDVYRQLLTEKKQQIFESYYFYDLSLSEIASIQGISRQGVLNALADAKNQLTFFEEKLKFVENKSKLLNALEEKDLDLIKKIITEEM